jgi:hypothetical protein
MENNFLCNSELRLFITQDFQLHEIHIGFVEMFLKNYVKISWPVKIKKSSYMFCISKWKLLMYAWKTLDWLIDCLRFYVPLKNFSLIWRRQHCRWRAAKFRPVLGAQGLWAGRDLYRATPAVTRDLGFSGLIRRTAPFSHLLRHTRGCGGSILTRILTGWKTLECWAAMLCCKLMVFKT